MTEADDLRKACSKKIREMIQAQRTKFVDGAERMGYGRELGETIFNKIEPFADYAFNKSHAYGYALIAYQNAWLKANYPVEYMAALLTSFRDDKDKAAIYLNEARQMGITVGVPDVNESLADYAPSQRAPMTILFGMAAVRNVGEALVERIVSEREAAGSFTSVYDFVRRVDPAVLNRRTMESLIKAGTFDSLGVTRMGLLLAADELIEATLSRRKDLSLGISTLFASLGDPAGGGAGRAPRCQSARSSSTRPSSSTSSVRCSAPTSPITRSTPWPTSSPPRPMAQSWLFESEPRSWRG